MASTRSGQNPSSSLRRPSDLVDSTSDFRFKDLKALNIVYENMTLWPLILQDDFNRSLLIDNMSKDILVSMWNNESLASHLNPKQHTVAEYVSEVLIKEMASAGKREKITDAFVNYLLGALEFNEYPLSLQLKSDCFFKVHNKTVTSEFDFAIYKRRMFAIIDEDKHINNVEHSTSWGEYQIAGEILAAAYSNHNKITADYIYQTLYAIRVIGTRFTFYKATISSSYIESLSEGFPCASMHVYRYPLWDGKRGLDNIPCLDYSIPDQRLQILKIMTSIKSYVINNDIATM
jgi:hypothetical protein